MKSKKQYENLPEVLSPMNQKPSFASSKPTLNGELSSTNKVSATKQLRIEAQSQQYLYITDPRTQAEVELQHRQTEEMYKNNLKVLGIKMTQKTKVQYVPKQSFKVDVGNGWYAMITDNNLNTQYTAFTVHGAPGDHREWAGLEKQMDESIRWINFVVPGFDNLDQRRGNYSGTADDLSKLIRLVLEERKVSKIVFIGHSMGSIFGSYFISKNRDIVKGYVNVTGIVNIWYTGLLTFYRVTAGAYGFNRGPNHASMIRLLNKNQYRQQHHRRFMADTRQVYFGTQVQFPQLTVTETCGYIKLLTSLPNGCSQFYRYNHNLSLLRVLIFGKKDPLHEPHKTQQQIYSITKGRFSFNQHPKNHKLISLMKAQLQQTLKEIFGIKIEAEKLQQYFCYHFDDTGHNAHKRRPKELSRILKIYVVVLRVMEKYQLVAQTRL